MRDLMKPRLNAILLLSWLWTVPAFSAVPQSSQEDSARPFQVQPAVDGILALFKRVPVVALGHAENMAQEEAFFSTLVRDPRFATEVRNVVAEFGGAHAQAIIDRYVDGQNVPFDELRHAWTDTAGAFAPGEPPPLGEVNFFATVRAVNQKLPPDQRIKVWLGDPDVDWAKIHSFADLQPYLGQRNAHMFQVLDQDILQKHRKALFLVGSAHLFGPAVMNTVAARMARRYPGQMAIVSPFVGYIEPACNAKFVAEAQSWPLPSLVGPIAGTKLQSMLSYPGCSYIPKAQKQMFEQMEHMKGPPPGMRMLGSGPPPSPGMQGPPPGMHFLGNHAPPPPAEMLAAELDILSGRQSDAILYLGPPNSLTESPIEPSSYLDLRYFKEAARRARCCSPPMMPPPYWEKWDSLVQHGSVAERPFSEH